MKIRYSMVYIYVKKIVLCAQIKAIRTVEQQEKIKYF